VTHLSAIADDSLSVQVSACTLSTSSAFPCRQIQLQLASFSFPPPPSIIQVASQKVGCLLLLLLLSSTATRGMGAGRDGAIPSKLPQVRPSSLIR